MRILYFYQYFTTPKGAWGTRVYEFARRWAQAGDKVTVVTSVYDKSDLKPSSLIGTFDIDGIEVKVINVRLSNKHGVIPRLWTFSAYALVASWYALTRRADVVVASSGPITVGIPGLVARFLRRRPLVFEVRDLWPEGAIELGYLRHPWLIRLARGFEHLCYNASTVVVALSEGMAEWIREFYGFDRTVVIPNASDNALFGAHDDEPPPEGLDPSRPLVIYTGTLGVTDDCAQIVRAAEELQRRNRSEIDVVMIGDGKERVMLEEMAREKGLANLRFLGLMPKTEVARWLRRARCALITFREVPFTDTMSPNKMFDAFAAGVPVVQTTQGWIRQLTMRERCGITVLPNDAAAAAEAILLLVDDPDLRDEMGRNARRVAREQFDRDVLAGRMREGLYAAAKGRK